MQSHIASLYTFILLTARIPHIPFRLLLSHREKHYSMTSTANDEEGKVKHVQTLRLSCDSCRFRKTRCDRKIRMEAGKNGCSFCTSVGLLCCVTPFFSARNSMPRLGKRMRVLLEESEENNGSGSNMGGNLSSSSPPNLPRRSTAPAHGKNSDLQGTPSSTPFLGVHGLTKAKLDNCIEAFFHRLGPCMPLSESSSMFWPRYLLFLDVACGASVQDYNGYEPASELLVLAVASRGCCNTELLDRHELTLAISERFHLLAKDGENLSLGTLDGMEAVNLISERVLRPPEILEIKSASTPLRLDVLERGSSVDLALMFNLNVPPSMDDADQEYRKRSCFVFWTIFAHDAFRSVAALRMYRIHEEDIGWTTPDQISMQTSSQPNYGKAMYTLAVIARSISRELLSIKAKKEGVSSLTLVDVVTRLNSWYEALDESFKFNWSLHRTSSSSSSSSTTTSFTEDNDGVELRSKRSFMLTIWLSLYLQVWGSISTTHASRNHQKNIILLESEVLKAYFRMASLARYCQRHDLVDCAPNELRNIPAAWALWYACYIRRSTDWNANRSAEKINELNEACHALVDCVRSSRSSEDSNELATRLVNVIGEALALAEQRMLRTRDNLPEHVDEHFEPHSSFILRAADQGLSAFKSSPKDKGSAHSIDVPVTTTSTTTTTDLYGHQTASYQMGFMDERPSYQSDILLNGPLTVGLGDHALISHHGSALTQPPMQTTDFLDMDMQSFLANCGIDSSLYKMV